MTPWATAKLERKKKRKRKRKADAAEWQFHLFRFILSAHVERGALAIASWRVRWVRLRLSRRASFAYALVVGLP
jgi:hypothetical protein